MVEFALNNSISASTGFTPFFLAFGFNPRTLPEEYEWIGIQDKGTDSAYQLCNVIQESIEAAKEALSSTQLIQQANYNRHRVPAPAYHVGDVVLLDSEGIPFRRSARIASG